MEARYEKVILIDDDPINNSVNEMCIRKFLGTCKAVKIQKFTNPRKGLMHIEQEYTSNQVKTILLLDINMPVMNGWKVLEELQRIKENIENAIDIYILSSSTNEEDRARAINNPLVKLYLEKPLHNYLASIFYSFHGNGLMETV